MKKQIYLLTFLVTSFCILGCSDSSEGVTDKENPQEELSELDIAKERIMEFSNIIRKDTLTRANLNLNLSLLDEQKVTVSKNDVNTRSAEKEEINLYTFEIESEKEKGFAIVSGHPSGRVYAYVEDGNIADTFFIKGAAEYIRNIPDICEDDYNLYSENQTTRVTNTMPPMSILKGPFLATKWNQRSPYNKLLPTKPGSGCDYYPVGCVATAVAQLLAYYAQYDLYPNTSIGVDLKALGKEKSFYSNSPLANEVAVLMKRIGTEVGMDYNCSGSGAPVKSTYRLLNRWGYKYYEKQNGEMNCWEINKSMITLGNNVVLAFGASDDAHVWVIDGVLLVAPVGMPPTPIDRQHFMSVHCNWGWGGSCDGWYTYGRTDFFKKPEPGASQDPYNPSNGGADISYHKNNHYIYMHQENIGFSNIIY